MLIEAVAYSVSFSKRRQKWNVLKTISFHQTLACVADAETEERDKGYPGSQTPKAEGN